MKKIKLNVFAITAVALLVAVQIVLSRFLSISMWNMKIGFSFLPIMLAARKFGPIEAMLVAGLSDFIGAILFPIGTYFPGFTATAVLVGMVYGLFLHKKCSLMRIVGSVAINEVVGSLLLNTLWISVLYNSPYLPLMATRSIQVIIMAVIEITLGYVMLIVGKNVIDKI